MRDQRHGAAGFDSGALTYRTARMIRATHHSLPRSQRLSCRCAFQVYDLVLDEDVFMLRKVQGRSAQLVDCRIMQREDGNFMGHHPAETTGNSREQLS